MNTYMLGLIMGSLVAGMIVGAIPAVLGAVKGKKGLAIGGFFACVAASFILGMLLAIPVCIVFVILILKKAKTNQEDNISEENENNENVE